MVAGQFGNNKVIGIIPARGGSKRIPRKNIIEFYGKPMIAWTIEAAKNAEVFDTILVSTDDEEIAEIAIKFGAEVPFLRQDANDDYSPVSLATISALKQIEGYKKEEFQTVIQLMANCPIRSGDLIKDVYKEYLKQPVSSVISCFPYGMFNPWWAHTIDENLVAKSFFEDQYNRNQRSQDQAKLYCPTGAIWISNRQTLLTSETFYSDKHRFYPISWLEAVDIDDYDDLNLAKAAYNILNS
jgi:CMP-N-acetylneuraminic acid synthetase